MPASKAKQAETATRRTELIKLRRQGIQFDDPRILALGYATPGAASKDMIRLLKQRRDEQQAEASVYRQEENERLDALLEAAWPRATQPSPVFDKEGNVVGEELDMRAVDTVIRLIDRRSKLNGLDMPVKSEVSGPDGGAIPLGGTLAELNQLIATAGESGPASDFAVASEAEDDDGNG